MNVSINISGTIKLLVDSITNIYAIQLKHRKRPVGKTVTIKNRVSIDQRPECINNKERFGDWEVDTIIGRQQKGAMLTIVERTTGMLIIKKLPKGKQAKGLSKELINRMMPYKKDTHIQLINATFRFEILSLLQNRKEGQFPLSLLC